MNPLDYLGFSGFPVIVGLVQVFKTTFPDAPSWANVISALAFSEAWGVGVAIAAQANVSIAVLTGIIVWLMSMGAWSGGKAVLGK